MRMIMIYNKGGVKMATDIGARIGLSGETNFKDSLSAINSQLKSLGSEMKAVVSSFTGMEKSQASVTAQSNILQKSIDVSEQKISLLQAQANNAKAKLSELEKELNTATQSFAANSKEVLRAESAYNRQVAKVNKLQTQINTATVDMNRMKKQMADLGKETDDLADDFQDAAKEAKDMGTSFKGAFIGGAISGAVQSLASGISDLVGSTMEYRKIMGTLEVSSQKAGYSAEQTEQSYQQLYSVIGDNQQAATATANLQALKLSQEQLTQLTEGAIGAWATYGDSIPIDGLAEAINETVKVGEVTGSFADVLNWAGTSEDEFNKKLADANSESERANLVLQELANQGLMQAAGAWREANADIAAANIATANLEATLGAFGTYLTPVVTLFKTGLNEILTGILSIVQAFETGGLTGGFAQIGNIGTQIIQGIQTAIPMVLTTFGQLFTQLTTYLAENLPTMIQAGLQSLVGFSEGLRSGVDTLVDAALSLVQTLANGIIQGIPVLIETVPQIVTNIAGIINDNAPKLIVAALTLIKNLAVGLIQAIPTLIANIPQIIEAVVSALLAFNWIGLGKNIITFLKDGITAMIPLVKETAGNIVTNIKTALANLPKLLLDIGKNGIRGLINGIKSLFETLGVVVKSIPKTIIDALKSLPSTLLQIGKDIIGGLIEGIKSKIGDVFGAITGFGNSVIDKFKETFDINSPSRVMRDKVGLMIGAGIAQGITNSTNFVISAVKKLSTGIIGETASIVEETQKTAKKIGDVLETEIEKTNQKINDIQNQYQAEQQAEELREYQTFLDNKYKELEKAEKENKQKILDEIAEKEKEWNKKQVDQARQTAQQVLQQQLSALQTFQQEYETALKNIESKQSSLADKLADYGALFERVKQEESESELFQLTDLDSQIAKIEQFGNAIEQLQQKGISNDLLAEITSMGMEDALAYMEKLIGLSDSAFDEYVRKFEEKQAAAQKAAEKVYQSEFQAVEQAFLQKLPQSIGNLKNEMFVLGAESANQFTAGLQSQGTNMGEIVQNTVSTAVTNGNEQTNEQTFLSITTGMLEQEPILFNYLQELQKRIMEILKSFLPQYVSMGKSFMEGISQGVLDGQSGLINTIVRVLRAAVQAARSEMQINSPSKVYGEIGGYMAEGIGVGWQNKMPSVSNIIRNGMQTIFPDTKADKQGFGAMDTRKNYSYGDVNIHIDTIQNGDERTVKILAREMDFLRRQQDMSRGGDRK